MLWSSDSDGQVYTLSPGANHWNLVPYNLIEIKRLSALEECIWAIGGDHQIYIFIPAQDVPIRIQEIAFENQRWNPVEGFTSRLMPTDRFPWSSRDGLVNRAQENIVLPTGNWQWEEDWYIQTNKKGEPLSPEGWTYAIDFPANYGPYSKWNSMVRRRKWIRHRRFTAQNMWAPVPGIFEDPVKEPFVDVSVGGLEIPGTDQEIFSVWAITILGRAMFRDGVRANCPEGTKWIHIETNGEVHQISVGPTGIVWAVCWDGSALVRMGVSRANIYGLSWIKIKSPGIEDCRLLQLSVGWNVLWATTNDGKVWFRKGIQSTGSGSAAAGSGWVEMVGEMSLVSVGKNDQVFAVGREDNMIYFRSGVTPVELSGKTWKAIRLTKRLQTNDFSRTTSSASLQWTSTSEGGQSVRSQDHYYSHIAEIADLSYKVDLLKPLECSSISVFEMKQHAPANANKDLETSHRRLSGSSSSSDVSETILDFVSQGPDGSEMFPAMTLSAATKIPPADKPNEIKSKCVFELSTEMPSYMEDWSQEANRESGFQNISEETEGMGFAASNSTWIWLSASACSIDSSAPPHHWFASSTEGKYGTVVTNTPWRQNIWLQLRKRSLKEIQRYQHLYPDAIEKSTWSKSGNCQMWNGILEDCSLELQSGELQGNNWAKLICKYRNKKLEINLNEVICVLNQSSSFKLLLALQVKEKPMVQLAFISNSELEDWLGTLNSTCSDLHSFALFHRTSSIWATTLNGEIYLVDGTDCNLDTENPAEMFWRLLGGGHLRKVESSGAGIVWGLGYNGVAWSYSGGFGGGPYASLIGRNEDVHHMVDSNCMYIYENQRWNPLTGFSARGLPTDRYMWSDRTGRHHCSKENTKLPSGHWQWISDWNIDFKTPGGVDKEGWQYASDFPRCYHGFKGFTDYVRRRRWVRRCKLISSGPWIPAGTTKLLDISIQVDSVSSSPIAVWAVAANGDALCRFGVTPEKPKGECWTQVPTEQALLSISVGTSRSVWAITQEGTALYRHAIHPNSCPTGEVWCDIEPPEAGCPLKQISVGRSLVLVIDEGERLWSRQEVVPIYPEGTSWKLIAEKVKNVSVGPEDQIWAVLDGIQSSSGELSGVVCRRKGITEENKLGTRWEIIIPGGWQSVNCRGIVQPHSQEENL